jgi:hypothetical protein
MKTKQRKKYNKKSFNKKTLRKKSYKKKTFNKKNFRKKSYKKTFNKKKFINLKGGGTPHETINDIIFSINETRNPEQWIEDIRNLYDELQNDSLKIKLFKDFRNIYDKLPDDIKHSQSLFDFMNELDRENNMIYRKMVASRAAARRAAAAREAREPTYVSLYDQPQLQARAGEEERATYVSLYDQPQLPARAGEGRVKREKNKPRYLSLYNGPSQLSSWPQLPPPSSTQDMYFNKLIRDYAGTGNLLVTEEIEAVAREAVAREARERQTNQAATPPNMFSKLSKSDQRNAMLAYQRALPFPVSVPPETEPSERSQDQIVTQGSRRGKKGNKGK